MQELPATTMAKLLREFRILLVPHLAIETCTSAASCTVVHSILLIPKHARFTNEATQALVGNSRATGVSIVIAPIAPHVNFINTLFMASWMLHKTLVRLPDTTAKDQSGLSVHEALDAVLDETLVAKGPWIL